MLNFWVSNFLNISFQICDIFNLPNTVNKLPSGTKTKHLCSLGPEHDRVTTSKRKERRGDFCFWDDSWNDLVVAWSLWLTNVGHPPWFSVSVIDTPGNASLLQYCLSYTEEQILHVFLAAVHVYIIDLILHLGRFWLWWRGHNCRRCFVFFIYVARKAGVKKEYIVLGASLSLSANVCDGRQRFLARSSPCIDLELIKQCWFTPGSLLAVQEG